MTVLNEYLLRKYEALKRIITETGSAAVAFSGGVDSALLLHVAKETLGENVTAVTVISKTVPESEINDAVQVCDEEKVRHVAINIDVFSIPGFARNPADRCYLCKKVIFGRIKEFAEKSGLNTILEGSNISDLGDYRPGLAALEEIGVKSPFIEAGFTKKDIRDLSRMLGLPLWSKPSAPCLASRIPYGETITAEKLYMAGEAEKILRGLGFEQLRVRVTGKTARIEIEKKDFSFLMTDDVRTNVCESLKKLGFVHVVLDLEGFRSGSLNADIGIENKNI